MNHGKLWTTMQTNKIILFAVFLLFQSRITFADSFDIFYLCVGSSYYEKDVNKYEEGFKGFPNAKGANRSARQMAELFDLIGAKDGINLVSTKKSFITKEKVFKGIDDIVQIVKKSKTKNPLIVFYFCGHGVSEGFGWNLFLMPGDFTHNIQANDIEDLSEDAIHALEVYDKLQATGLRYITLFDCCYEGDAEAVNVSSYIISNEGNNLIQSTLKIVRYMNEMHGDDPALFAIAPGNVALTVDNPLQTEYPEPVGPLCRRSLMIFYKRLNDPMGISLGDYVILMTNGDFDTQTRGAVSLWEWKASAMDELKKSKSE